MPNLIMVAFVMLGLLLAGSWLAFYNPGHKRGRRRLRTLAASGRGGEAVEPVDVIRRRRLSDIPWLNDLLVRLPLLRALGRLLEQANSPYSAGVFLLLSLLLGCGGFLVGPLVLHNAPLSWLGAMALGMAPCFYVYRRKQQRMRQFERQLPEALELVARSLRAGHPFIVGMQLVGDEFSDPIGTEFTTTVHEINFGIGVPEALKSLSYRVDCPDLLFFVTSVIVQREVGGNLAEILEKTGHLIRQRFELQGRVRILAAEGKLSAIILCALPFVLAFALNFLNPGYLEPLFTEPLGKGMLLVAGIMMAMGMLVIRKMVRIRV